MRKTIVLALLLAGCSGSPSVTGNELGGVMSWSGSDQSAAFKAAQSHCEKFGRSARITQIAPTGSSDKKTVVFVCEKA